MTNASASNVRNRNARMNATTIDSIVSRMVAADGSDDLRAGSADAARSGRGVLTAGDRFLAMAFARGFQFIRESNDAGSAGFGGAGNIANFAKVRNGNTQYETVETAYARCSFGFPKRSPSRNGRRCLGGPTAQHATARGGAKRNP